MNDKPETKIGYISPLKRICMTIGELPTSYLETMSYYEMLVWFVEFLKNQVIPVVNNNSEATEELQHLFIELQSYVNNYFDNLDVQDEINNKLDEMAEDGVLEQIIEQYLNSSAIWGFDTVADMKTATNLIDGSFARTLGYYEANDGGGSLYKITDTESETDYQEELESGLYATKIKDYFAQFIFPRNFGNISNQGVGDTSIIKAYNKNILIDTSLSTYVYQFSQFLQRNNVSHLDYVILSHYDSDHISNFDFLINNNIVDKNTQILLPAMTNKYDSAGIARYEELITLLNNNNLLYSYPTEGSTINIGKDFDITFYNCDADYINSRPDYVGSNMCSMICYVKCGNRRVLYTGDNYRQPLDKLVDDNSIESKVDLYKVEHHGLEYEQGKTPRRLLDYITPDYAFVNVGITHFEGDGVTSSITLSHLNSLGTKIFLQYENENDVIFTSDGDNFINDTGRATNNISNNYNTYTFYVDSNAENSTLQGTQENPFTSLCQAIGKANNLINSRIILNLADGNYNEGSTKNTPRFINCNVKIIGNSLNKNNVIIKQGVICYNSTVYIDHCTLLSDTDSAITINNSTLTMDNCVIKSLNETLTNVNTGIMSNDSVINLLKCSFNNLNLGISTHRDIIKINETSFDTLSTGIYLRNTLLALSDLTFNNITNNNIYKNMDSNIVENPNLLYSGIVVTQTHDITLSDAITNYNELEILIGRRNNNSLATHKIIPYTATFETGTTFKLVDLIVNDVITIEIDSDNAKLLHISHSLSDTTKTSPVNKIWAFSTIKKLSLT